MAIESRFVPTPYGTFHVDSTGRGKPVMFIDGGTASTPESKLVLEPLGKHARCVAIDRTIATIYADPKRVPASYRDDLRWKMDHADDGQFGGVADEFERIARERLNRFTIPTLGVTGIDVGISDLADPAAFDLMGSELVAGMAKLRASWTRLGHV